MVSADIEAPLLRTQRLQNKKRKYDDLATLEKLEKQISEKQSNVSVSATYIQENRKETRKNIPHVLLKHMITE